MNTELNDSLEGMISNIQTLGTRENRAAVIQDRFRRTHRTLQQMFVASVIIPILSHLAQSYKDGAYDGRNEASAKLASKMIEAVTEDDLYLPFI